MSRIGLGPTRRPPFAGSDRAAVVSGVLLAAAAPPSPLPLLALGALAPLFLALARLPAGRAGRQAALRAGVVHGLTAWALLLLWMPQASVRVGLWLVLGWIAVVFTLALLSGVAAVAVHHLAGRRAVALPVAAALGWGGVEWVRTAWLGPLDFPWMGLALPLAEVPELIQGAAWVGEIGLSLAVAGCNGLIATALPDPRRRWPRLALLGGGVVATFAAGAVRMNRAATQPTLRARLVQPAVPLTVKRGDPAGALQASMAAVEAVLPPPGPPMAPPVGGDLVVLPETAVPAVLDGAGPGADAAAAAGAGAGSDPIRERVAGWALRMGAPVLVGAWAEAPGRGANAVFLAGPDAAADWPVSWKERLVPGVEWVPGGESVARGDGPVVLTLPGGIGLAPLVCIESAGPEPARALVRAGAQVLVNVTNDSWLGERPWWTRSAAWHQHPAHLAFRAVELGVGALRVGNNGSTEVVDPFGRRTRIVPPRVAGQGLAQAERLAGATVFTAAGPVAGTVAVVLACLLALLPGRRRDLGGGEASSESTVDPT